MANHDIAKSRSEIDSMIETLDAVFVNGSVFQRVFDPAFGGLQFCRGDEIGFISAKVVKNLRRNLCFMQAVTLCCCGGLGYS